MSSYRAAAEAPLPWSDEESWEGHQHAVLEQSNSKQNVRCEWRQPFGQIQRETSHVKENTARNPYLDVVDTSGLSHQRDLEDKQPYYRPPPTRYQRGTSCGKQDAFLSSSNYKRKPRIVRRSQEQSLPHREQDWQPYPEKRKASRKLEQRKELWEYKSSKEHSKWSYEEISKISKPSKIGDSCMRSRENSHSRLMVVPLPDRQQQIYYPSANSARKSSSGSDNKYRDSHNSRSSRGENTRLKSPPSNPYSSSQTKSFTDIGLPPAFIKALTDMNFVQPTQIQAHALPLILDNKRFGVMGHAKAGSGKTAAFGIGMLYWSSAKSKRCEALAVCPTRELATQVHEVVVRLAKYTKHKIFLAVPGCNSRSRITEPIVIGTPGKIYYDLLGGEGLRKQQHSRHRKKPLINAQHVRMFVIDEADLLLTKQAGLSDTVLKCREMLLPDVQVLCFSATFDDEARRFVNLVSPGATLVEVQPSKEEKDAGKRIPGGINSLKIIHILAKCKGETNKYECLSDMFGYFNIGQGLIFVQSRDGANRLSSQLCEEGYQVGIIHGKMPKAMRDGVMDDFRAGRSTHLITSNLLSRGIDIPNISVVINYDIPLGKLVDRNGESSWGPDLDAYIHRAGRTGRFGRNGACITLIHDQASLRKFSIITKRLENDYGLKIKQIDADSLHKIEEDVNSHLAS